MEKENFIKSRRLALVRCLQLRAHVWKTQIETLQKGLKKKDKMPKHSIRRGG